jgi:hypothetical protein|tara:strand:- start:59 stop:613 length:555 start_codon:yes stop_codon:yes gene_type:complete
MAIDSRGQVTTTGLMNQSPGVNVRAPDMSNLVQPKQPVRQPEQVKKPVRTEQTTPVQTATTGKSNAITDEDMAVLSPVLSPSVVNVLRKLVPKFGPFLAQAGTGEENIVLPRSIVVSYATRMYGGNEDEAVQNFVADLSSTQMDTNNVPLDRTTDQMSSGMMAKNEPQLPEQDDSGVDVNQDLV